MNFTGKLAAVALTLALGACSNVTNSNGGSGAGGSGASGAASNPSSPAYFNEAIGDRVLFVVNEATLTSEAQTILDGQARWLGANAAYTAVIEGHADEQGTREYNLALGASRANNVRAYLIERGVAPNRLQVVSYGKERPLEICSSEACYQKNRRAVTVLSTGVSG